LKKGWKKQSSSQLQKKRMGGGSLIGETDVQSEGRKKGGWGGMKPQSSTSVREKLGSCEHWDQGGERGVLVAEKIQ